MNRIIGVLASIVLSSCAVASGNPIAMPESDSQRLFAGNTSMTTESFFKAYMSTDIEQRRLAEMYVVGVIDSSEGELWCGYGIASPGALQEQVYIGLKRAFENSPKQRASTAIKSHLKELLPCKEAK